MQALSPPNSAPTPPVSPALGYSHVNRMNSPALSSVSSTDSTCGIQSSLEGGDAEPFFDRIHWDPTCQLYSTVGHQSVLTNLVLKPKIEKGFFIRDGKWTCFRRNHFQVALDMEFEFPSPSSGKDLHLNEDGMRVNLRQFYVTIQAHGALSFSQLKIYQSSSSSSHIDVAPIDFSPQQKSRVSFRRLQFNQSTPANSNKHYADRFFSISVQVHCIGEDGIVRKIAECHSAKLVVLSGTPGQYKAKENGTSPLGVKNSMKREARPFAIPSHRPTSSAPNGDYALDVLTRSFSPSHKSSHSFDYNSYADLRSPDLLSGVATSTMPLTNLSYSAWSSGSPELFSPPGPHSPAFVQSYPMSTTPQPDINTFFDSSYQPYESYKPSFLVSPESMQYHASPLMTASQPQEGEWEQAKVAPATSTTLDAKIQDFFFDFNN